MRLQGQRARGPGLGGQRLGAQCFASQALEGQGQVTEKTSTPRFSLREPWKSPRGAQELGALCMVGASTDGTMARRTMLQKASSWVCGRDPWAPASPCLMPPCPGAGHILPSSGSEADSSHLPLLTQLSESEDSGCQRGTSSPSPGLLMKGKGPSLCHLSVLVSPPVQAPATDKTGALAGGRAGRLGRARQSRGSWSPSKGPGPVSPTDNTAQGPGCLQGPPNRNEGWRRQAAVSLLVWLILPEAPAAPEASCPSEGTQVAPPLARMVTSSTGVHRAHLEAACVLP